MEPRQDIVPSGDPLMLLGVIAGSSKIPPHQTLSTPPSPTFSNLALLSYQLNYFSQCCKPIWWEWQFKFGFIIPPPSLKSTQDWQLSHRWYSEAPNWQSLRMTSLSSPAASKTRSTLEVSRGLVVWSRLARSPTQRATTCSSAIAPSLQDLCR